MTATSATARPRARGPATVGVRAWIGTGAAAAVVALCLATALGAAEGSTLLVPAGKLEFPSWLAGPLQGSGFTLGKGGIGVILVLSLGAYLVAVRCATEMPWRGLVAAIVAAHLVVALAPPLLSADVFGYLGYARLGASHGLSPYLHGAAALGTDPVRPFIRWHDVTSPYGPLFTLATYPLAALSPSSGLWTLKAVSLAAGLGLVALVARLAEGLGESPRRAVALVGLNPLLLLYAVGGAHNDLLLALAMTGAIALVLSDRAGEGGALLGIGVAIKASAVVLAPFLVLGARPRARALGGLAAVAAVVVAVFVAAFGGSADGLWDQLVGRQDLASHHSVPGEAARLVNRAPVPPSFRAFGLALAATGAAIALWWTARTGRWIAGAGWAILAVLAGSSYLLPWYVVWLLPLAAIGGDRRLELATLFFTAFIVLTHARPLLL